MQPYPGAPNSGERWNVNMPAVIGVVFVFLVGVIVWVIVSSASDPSPERSGTASAPANDASATPSAGSESPGATSATTLAPLPSTTAGTTPTPLPVTVAPESTAPSTAPTTAPVTAPATTAVGADPDAVPGDLAIAGRPMQQPGCDGAFITVLASAVGASATAVGIEAVLDAYPGSNYLRTDQTCPSLTQNIDGEPIYVVFFGPFPFASDACAARADGSPDAYARELSSEVSANHSVGCA